MLVRDQLPLVVSVPDHDDDALLRFAARQALLRGCPVRLLHAGRGERAAGVVASAVTRTEALAGPGVMVTGAVVSGPPVAAVLRARGECQGLVVRHRDVLRLQREIGEVAGAVADTVVTCVPTTWAAVPDDDRPVLVGVDDAATAGAAITHGLELARLHDTSLRVVHAWWLPRQHGAMVDPRIGDHWSELVRSSLAAVVDRCRSGALARVPVEIVVEHGVSADRVVAGGRAAQALVLQRNRGHEGPEHVGRTTRAALHECPCPVVLLPHGPTPE